VPFEDAADVGSVVRALGAVTHLPSAASTKAARAAGKRGRPPSSFQRSQDLRVKSDLSRRIKLICPVQPVLKKYFCFSEMQIRCMICHPIPKEGRCATSSTRDGDAVDADGACDESA
jgi:hypothetical protein